MSAGAVVPRKGRLRPPTLKVSNSIISQEKSSSVQLSQVSPSLFISGYEAAKNPDLLSLSSITHILNLAGELKCPNSFPSSFRYYSLKMPDNPKIDILFFLYFAMEFIMDSEQNQGKVLVHCVKGTSRAAAVALAYLMLQGYSEQEAYTRLHSTQADIDPNLGFVCQLRELRMVKQEPRVFYYSEKYDMFVNIGNLQGNRIEIVGNSCTLFLNSQTPAIQQQIGLYSIRLWEKFNESAARVVYL